ncbi:MAG: HAMP domain-containing histidine kinase [Alphaproteobacteria bacterium]|nr:HAMP domain-containing histidine kinase [Alphaproteobacteria bacterium]
MSLFTRSLRVRILFNVFLSSSLMMLLLAGVIFVQTTKLTESLVQEELLEQARKIASFIEYDWIGRLQVDLPRRYKEYYTGTSAYHQYAVLTASGDVLFSSDNFMHDQIKGTLSKGGKHYFNFKTEDGRYYAGLKYDYLFEEKIYPVYVIEYEEEFSDFIRELEHNFLRNLLIYGGPLLLIQAICLAWIFRNALKPVLEAAREARKIKFDNLSFRLNEQHIHSELLPLIHGMNISLARLEKGVENQKYFIANAAHELRTPISILKARIASLKDEKEIFMLNEDLRNINRLISQMLDVSRMELAEAGPTSEVNLNEIAQKACQDIGPLFLEARKDLSFEQQAKNLTVYGNEDTLSRALLNLLENALKHTPPETPVKVIVKDKAIIVRDYGKPIPDEHKVKIFEKFEKTPDSLNVSGSGLGLSIVKKAAALHNASIRVESRANGNDFVLDFG